MMAKLLGKMEENLVEGRLLTLRLKDADHNQESSLNDLQLKKQRYQMKLM